QAFVVPDDLGDDEAQEGLGEDRVEARLIGQGAQTPDLVLLAGRIGRGQAVGGLEDPDALGVPDPVGQMCTRAASMLSMLRRSASRSSSARMVSSGRPEASPEPVAAAAIRRCAPAGSVPGPGPSPWW